MKQKKGLGSIPKGLQWIGSDIDNEVENEIEEVPISKAQAQNIAQAPLQQNRNNDVEVKQHYQPTSNPQIIHSQFQTPLQQQPQMPQPQMFQHPMPQHREVISQTQAMPIQQSSPSPVPVQQNSWASIRESMPMDHLSFDQNMLQSNDQKGSSQKGLQDGWTRATFILKQDYIEKLKAVSYWERMTIKEVIDEALTLYLQNKNIQDIPKRRARI